MSKTKENGRVELSIPRGSERGDPNLFVAVNGVNYLLPRGKKSAVPPEVAAEIARAEAAQQALDETRRALATQA